MTNILMKYVYLLFDKIILFILSNVHVAEHVGFICDGNRTYGKRNNLILENAYKMGIHKILECSRWVEMIGVKEITFYLFGKTNLSRDDNSVRKVFDSIHYYLCTLLSLEKKAKNETIYSYRILGDVTLVSEQIQEACKQLETIARTKTEPKVFINLAIGYSGKDDMIDACAITLKCLRENNLDPNFDEDFFSKSCFPQNNLLPLSMIIRTAGHKRISNFLTWQAAYSCINIRTAYWPEISIDDLFKSLIYYQLFRVHYRR